MESIWTTNLPAELFLWSIINIAATHFPPATDCFGSGRLRRSINNTTPGCHGPPIQTTHTHCLISWSRWSCGEQLEVDCVMRAYVWWGADDPPIKKHFPSLQVSAVTQGADWANSLVSARAEYFMCNPTSLKRVRKDESALSGASDRYSSDLRAAGCFSVSQHEITSNWRQ